MKITQEEMFTKSFATVNDFVNSCQVQSVEEIKECLLALGCMIISTIDALEKSDIERPPTTH